MEKWHKIHNTYNCFDGSNFLRYFTILDDVCQRKRWQTSIKRPWKADRKLRKRRM